MKRWAIFTVIAVCGCSPAEPPPAKPEPAAAPQSTATPAVPEQGEPVIEEKTAAEKQPPTAPGTEQTAATPASEELQLEILDWEQAHALGAAHPSKIVVMDLWATYCAPCLKELPGLVALQAKYPDEVHCISVSLDYEGDPDATTEKLAPEVQQVLAKMKAHRVQNILLSTEAEKVFEVIHGSIPAVFVFDRSGKLVHTFPDRKSKMAEASYAEVITPAVEALLKESPQK